MVIPHTMGPSNRRFTIPSICYIFSHENTPRVTGINGQNAKVDGRVEQFQEVLKARLYKKQRGTL